MNFPYSAQYGCEAIDFVDNKEPIVIAMGAYIMRLLDIEWLHSMHVPVFLCLWVDG
jgi:hypothetical protein